MKGDSVFPLNYHLIVDPCFLGKIRSTHSRLKQELETELSGQSYCNAYTVQRKSCAKDCSLVESEFEKSLD